MLKIVASGCRVLTPGQRPQEIQISRPETVPMHSSLRPVHSSYSMRGAVILNGCRVEKNGEVFVRYGNLKEKKEETVLMQGIHYIVRGQQLMAKSAKGERKISNATIRIIKKLSRISLQDLEKQFFVCEVHCQRWKAGDNRILEIAAEEYGHIFAILKEKFPDIVLFQGSGDAVSEYIADSYAESEKSWSIEKQFEKAGWGADVDNTEKFHHGQHPFYANWSMPTPWSVSMEERKQIYAAGERFLEVGKQGCAAGVIFTFAHAGFSLFWLRKAGVEVSTALYVRGETGSLKTSVCREIANVFETDVRQRVFPFTSTWASIYQRLLLMQDNVTLIDDFSMTEKRSSADATAIFEQVIRAVGDGHLPAKMRSGGNVQNLTKLRTAVIMTGEDDPPLGRSSNLRMLTLSVDRQTFDSECLRDFQQHPSIMQRYFALFIQYLEENGSRLPIDDDINVYRQRYQVLCAEPRYIELAVALRLQVNIIGDFSLWCGNTREDTMQMIRQLGDQIDEAVQLNQKASKNYRPEVLFAQAFAEVFTDDSSARLAADGDEYYQAQATPSFIGFYHRGDRTVWLHPSKTFSFLREYWGKHGRPWLTTEKRLKEALACSKLLKKPEQGFVWRWPHGQKRGRFIVIDEVKMGDVIQEMEGSF